MANRGKREGAEIEAAWARGRPAELKRERPSSSVLSIRVPTELLETLSERAKTEGKPASLLARDLIERGLAIEGPMTPADLARMFARWVEETLPAGGTRPSRVAER